uniref:Uncharacterized protein n=1 Tax=Setaria italica TaxID=4555 RepID=K3YEZ8_SETIT
MVFDIHSLRRSFLCTYFFSSQNEEDRFDPWALVSVYTYSTCVRSSPAIIFRA